MTNTATAAQTTVQLFVAYYDKATGKEWFDTEDHATTTDALADLVGTAKELGWNITPGLDEDGKIVFHLTGDDIQDGLATIN